MSANIAKGIISAIFLVVAQPALKNAFAQDAALPSQIEREFWASTRQIDTGGAYQAYLNKFPNGYFASLASAAIKKVDNTVSGSAQLNPWPTKAFAASGSSSESTRFNPAKIAGPTSSSAITQQVGDVFNGPGPITVGWLGAKKQIVVPGGQWILLAAEDSSSRHTEPMSVTALILARFEGSTVRSFLLARFSSKMGNPRNTWSDANACEQAPSSAPFAWHEKGYLVSQCVRSTLLTQNNAAKTFSGSLWKQAMQTLTTGGGGLPSTSYLLTDMFYTGDLSNYLRITRIDFGVSPKEVSERIGVGATTSSIDLSMETRERWARAYSALAAQGYRKKLSEDELYEGNAATITSATLPD